MAILAFTVGIHLLRISPASDGAVIDPVDYECAWYSDRHSCGAAQNPQRICSTAVPTVRTVSDHSAGPGVKR